MTSYIEVTTDADADALEIEAGQAYAASVGKPWPMPPDAAGKGRYGARRGAGGIVLTTDTPYDQLTAEQQAAIPKQTRYKRAVRYRDIDPLDTTEGGVLEVDIALTLPRRVLKTREQLSIRAQTLLTARENAAQITAKVL